MGSLANSVAEGELRRLKLGEDAPFRFVSNNISGFLVSKGKSSSSASLFSMFSSVLLGEENSFGGAGALLLGAAISMLVLAAFIPELLVSASLGGAGALLLGAESSFGGAGALLLGAASSTFALGSIKSELLVSASVGGAGALLLGAESSLGGAGAVLLGAASSFGDEGAIVLGINSSRGLVLISMLILLRWSTVHQLGKNARLKN